MGVLLHCVLVIVSRKEYKTPSVNLAQHINVSSKTSRDPHLTNQCGGAGMTATFRLRKYVCVPREVLFNVLKASTV